MDQLSAHLDRGWDLVQRGDAQGAELSAKRALDLDGDSPEAYNLLGYAAALRGDFDDAMEHYEHAIALDDTYLEAVLNAAELCIYPLADFPAAERYCDDALALAESDEERADALLLKFDALMGSGQTKAAKELCARLPRENFENPVHAFLVARALYEVGEVQAASPLIEVAVRVNPTSPEAYYYQGLIADEQGNARLALNAFLKSRELELSTPLPPWTVSNESFLELVNKIVSELPAEAMAVVDAEQVFVTDLPGAEVVVDGVDPRALVLVEPSSSTVADDAEQAHSAVPADVPPLARIFVYQRNLERISGTVEGMAQELAQALERELLAYRDGVASDSPTARN
jgi:tetratricopeptide (TPR) repeat protein